MNIADLEHRIYCQTPPREEHNTDSEHCWCQPYIEVQENGDKVIVHNDISEFFEDKESRIGH